MQTAVGKSLTLGVSAARYCMGACAVGGIVLLAGCFWQRDTLLYVRDEVCTPGDTITLTAKLEENDWHWEDVEGKPLSFTNVKGGDKIEFLGGDVTDREGRARVSFRPPAPGDYTIECQFAGAPGLRPTSFRARVLCQQPARYGIILDIDKTLAATSIKDVFAGRLRLALPLDLDTVRVVNDLAKEYDLFIVTSRPRTQAAAVLDWLTGNGFPRVPTFFYDPRAEAIRPAMAKRKIIQDLKRRDPFIAVGIGDRESDLEGYMRDGLLAIGIGREEKGAFAARRWSDVEALLFSEPDPAVVPQQLIVHRGKDVAQFWPSHEGNRWKLEYALKEGAFQSAPFDSWPNQLKNILKLITALQAKLER